MRTDLCTVVVAGIVGGAALAGEAPVVQGQTLFDRTSQSVTYGPYLRLEAGRASTDLSGANWLPPDPRDPRVFFDSTDDDNAFVGAAIGFDWMNGFRAEGALLSAGGRDATGSWIIPASEVAGPYPDITAARVRTTALMGNLYYVPLEQRGVNSRVQPYLVAGLGLARNEMSDWTLTNAAAPVPVRSFAGASRIDIAYSIGLGVEMQVTRPGQHPVLIDLSWRFYDFGTAKGSATPLTGGAPPREVFNVDRTDRVVSAGVRIPLRRY